MVRRRVISVVLAILLVACMIVEAIYIKRLESQNNELQEKFNTLQTNTAKETQETESRIENVVEKPVEEETEICIPKNIYVCAGTMLDIYDEAICCGMNLGDYELSWECEIGDNMSDRFRVQTDESSIGNYTLTFRVYDLNHALVDEQISSLHVVRNVFLDEEAQTVSMCSLGDDYSADTRWLSYTRELAKGKLEHVGTRGEKEGLMHEAIKGISLAEYVYGASVGYEGTSAFINPESEVFDWRYYEATTGIRPNVVQIFLSANGMSMEPEEYCNVISEMIDSIKAANPNAYIMLVEPIYRSRQDGVGRTSNEIQNKKIDTKYENTKVFHLMATMEKRFAETENVILVPAGVSLNQDSGFDQIMVLDNPHGKTFKMVSAQAVLPSAAGYEQIGDSIYGTLCYLLSEGKIN